jgi:erythrocyte band 7 integral membrane protein
VVFYHVTHPIDSIIRVANASQSTGLLAQTTLRNILGMRTLSDLLNERRDINVEIGQVLQDATQSWGIQVERVEIQNVSLPMSLQRVMAAEAEAAREGRAKVIAADGELRSARALKDAADVLSTSTPALHLRLLQTYSSISGREYDLRTFR